jgi:hypothetical protein
MGIRQIIAIGLALAGFAALPGPASAAPSGSVRFEPVESVATGFLVRATHGYTIRASAYAEAGRRGVLTLSVARPGASATYAVPADVSEDAIRADLGSLGKVDLTLHRSGQKRTAHPRCWKPETYEAARWEGNFEFNGEDGYARARRAAVPFRPFGVLYGGIICGGGGGYGETFGPGNPGARLKGVSYAHGRTLSFQLNQNRPGARVTFSASLAERRDGMVIHRSLETDLPGTSFHWDRRLRTATLSPPAPFAGSASLSRDRNSIAPLWRGNLSLDFPGHAELRIAGPSVHVSLLHARRTESKGGDGSISF